MIDPRYYYDNIDSVLNSYGITDVLYLYSADTFLKDTSLSKMYLPPRRVKIQVVGRQTPLQRIL